MTQSSLVELVKDAFGSVSKGQLPAGPILKALINKGLGYGVLAGACITRVPQIYNIVNAQSADGLSALSFELETYTMVIHTAYGYLNGMAFSSYGEALILALQNFIILALIYKFTKAGWSRAGSTFSFYGAIVTGIAAGNLNRAFINTLYEANSLVVLVSRVPQIFKAFKDKNTGQLSLITCSINVVGSAIRIYTSSQEDAGGALMRAYGLSLSLNLLLVTQIVLYYKRTQRAATEKAKERAAAVVAGKAEPESKKAK